MTASQTATEIPTAGAMSSATGGDLTGLTKADAAQRLAQYGENALVEHHVSVFERLAHFFWGPIPWMIEIAAVLSAVLQALGGPRHHSGDAVHQCRRRLLAGVQG